MAGIPLQSCHQSCHHCTIGTRVGRGCLRLLWCRRLSRVSRGGDPSWPHKKRGGKPPSNKTLFSQSHVPFMWLLRLHGGADSGAGAAQGRESQKNWHVALKTLISSQTPNQMWSTRFLRTRPLRPNTSSSWTAATPPPPLAFRACSSLSESPVACPAEESKPR